MMFWDPPPFGLPPIEEGGPRFYKSSAAAAMAGGPKDFGGTKELVQLFGPPKAGRTKELGGPKC